MFSERSVAPTRYSFYPGAYHNERVYRGAQDVDDQGIFVNSTSVIYFSEVYCFSRTPSLRTLDT